MSTAQIILPSANGHAWPEAEIVTNPLKAKALERQGPTVLVRRRRSLILGSREEEIVYLRGYPAISLFTGCGGFDLGIERAGFIVLCQHEWDESCCRTLMANRPHCFRHAALVQGDIRKTPTAMLLREAGLRVGECRLVTGGPPCQGFSTANSRRNSSDLRNTLVYEFLRCVREIQAHYFLFENVPGFTTLSGGDFAKAFLAMAHEGFYELVYGIANAVEYGVPQNRNRFFCMGTRRDLVECDGILGSLPGPTHFDQRDLDYLASVERETLFGIDSRAEMLRHPPGIRYFPDRPVLFPPAPTNAGGRTEPFIEFYRRLRKEEPDRIVDRPIGGVC